MKHSIVVIILFLLCFCVVLKLNVQSYVCLAFKLFFMENRTVTQPPLKYMIFQQMQAKMLSFPF